MKSQARSEFPFIPLASLAVTSILLGVAFTTRDQDQFETPFWLQAAIIFTAGTVFCYIAKVCCSCQSGHSLRTHEGQFVGQDFTSESSWDQDEESLPDDGAVYHDLPWYERLLVKILDWIKPAEHPDHLPTSGYLVLVDSEDESHGSSRLKPAGEHHPSHPEVHEATHIDHSNCRSLRKLNAQDAELNLTYHDPSDGSHWRVIERRAKKMSVDVKGRQETHGMDRSHQQEHASFEDISLRLPEGSLKKPKGRKFPWSLLPWSSEGTPKTHVQEAHLSPAWNQLPSHDEDDCTREIIFTAIFSFLGTAAGIFELVALE